MSSEMRLIDANAIKYTEYRSGGGRDEPVNIVTEYEIARMPSVDAVEVVRCKNCAYGILDEENDMYKCVKSAEYDFEFSDWVGFVGYHTPDYYCADGERSNYG